VHLDDVVPAADHVTRQAQRIDAPPTAVWEELHRVRMSRLPVTAALSTARFLPVVLAGRGTGHLRDRTFLDVVPVPLLAAEPPVSVVFGGVLQAWRLSGWDLPTVLDAEGVRRFAEPGWVKAAMDFRLTPSRGGTELSSETRVLATDPATRRRFDRYWRVIRPGSSAIRWELLAAVQVRAESRGS
jgi:hypothetical protein